MSDTPEREVFTIVRSDGSVDVWLDPAEPGIKHVRADIVQAQIDAAVLAERERCAKVADAQEAVATAREEKADDDENDWGGDWAAGVVFGTKIGARKIAAAIRKGDQP